MLERSYALHPTAQRGFVGVLAWMLAGNPQAARRLLDSSARIKADSLERVLGRFEGRSTARTPPGP